MVWEYWETKQLLWARLTAFSITNKEFVPAGKPALLALSRWCFATSTVILSAHGAIVSALQIWVKYQPHCCSSNALNPGLQHFYRDVGPLVLEMMNKDSEDSCTEELSNPWLYSFYCPGRKGTWVKLFLQAPHSKPPWRRMLQTDTKDNNFSLHAHTSPNLYDTNLFNLTYANYLFFLSSLSTRQDRKRLLSYSTLEGAIHVALRVIKQTSAWTTFKFPYFVCSKRKLFDLLCFIYLKQPALC